VFKPISVGFTDFYALMFSSSFYRAEFRMRCQGIGDGMMPLYSSAFLKTPSLSPPADEQQKIFASIVDSTRNIAQTVSRLEREIELLVEYRIRLTADVVTGNLDVREVAAKIPEDVQLDTASGEDFTDDEETLDQEASE
jgi:type I restriction enzyme S subunit